MNKQKERKMKKTKNKNKFVFNLIFNTRFFTNVAFHFILLLCLWL